MFRSKDTPTEVALIVVALAAELRVTA